MGKYDTDHRLAALVLEVERRRKLPGLHDYSYGRLIADTTLEERNTIAENYKNKRRFKQSGEVYRETDDGEELRKLTKQVEE